ncbi:hypothetical protein EDD30_3539 [Couchioplanes caeruleus]|uniref:MOSC domain-containing protein n=3 Tax=Couchioplanes caeruleus TaxID=56438 RepID=A0A1K0GKM1_9ACTN|nr:hypothetical protein BG844_18625 [Couchioplanes caeruleus subsp. caeruleus]ROP30681.1 hypothetical protein EDD30_3539 [Couchioplanes caeruleus]
MAGRLDRILTYPVKAARGSALSAAAVEPWGLAGDRRWAIVDDQHRLLGVVGCPAIMTITPHVQADGGLVLAAPARSPVRVPPLGPNASRIEAGSEGLDVAVVTDPAVDDWLADTLGRPAKVVWQDDPSRKPMVAEDGGRDGDIVSLAHAAPLLLTSAESLDQLDRWIAAGAPQEAGSGSTPARLDVMRFRPNIVVAGFEPFVEDHWDRVTVGTVSFRVSAPCYRCAVTLVDPDTLARGKEPIRTLARYRNRGRKVHFGVWLVPENTGFIRLDDEVVPERPAGSSPRTVSLGSQGSRIRGLVGPQGDADGGDHQSEGRP